MASQETDIGGGFPWEKDVNGSGLVLAWATNWEKRRRARAWERRRMESSVRAVV